MTQPSLNKTALVLILLLLSACGWQWHLIRQENEINQAITSVPAQLKDIASLSLSETRQAVPDVQLAIASALSKGGNLEEAEKRFQALIQQHEGQKIASVAQYNLANAYLRAGQKSTLQPAKAQPLLELAKQRYRDFLKNNPEHWDARYNLEQALRLAPEGVDNFDKKNPRVKSVNVIVPGFKAKDLP